MAQKQSSPKRGRGPDLKQRKNRSDVGPLSASWKGGRRINPQGYIDIINSSGHGKHRVEHRMIVERVMGKPLPVSAKVHHVNTDRSDNRNCNLVVLQSDADHAELHRKMRVRAHGGDPWLDRMCCTCGPRPSEAFYRTKKGGYSGECKSCSIKRTTERVERIGRDQFNAERRRVYRIEVHTA